MCALRKPDFVKYFKHCQNALLKFGWRLAFQWCQREDYYAAWVKHSPYMEEDRGDISKTSLQLIFFHPCFLSMTKGGLTKVGFLPNCIQEFTLWGLCKSSKARSKSILVDVDRKRGLEANGFTKETIKEFGQQIACVSDCPLYILVMRVIKGVAKWWVFSCNRFVHQKKRKNESPKHIHKF